MMPWHASLTEALGWAVLHSLWQGVLVAALLFAVRKATQAPLARYSAGLIALAAMPVLFVCTTAVQFPAPIQSAGMPTPAILDATPPQLGSSDTSPSTPLPGTYVEYVTMLWLLGACACHAWQIVGLISIARLRRRGICGTLPREWQQALSRYVQVLGIQRPVRLLESVLVDTPVVIGHLRPLILMPAGLVSGLPAAQLETILLHELAHVRRCDYAVNLVQRWLESVFFYHPAFWWMSRVVREERENCCDDIAVAVTGKPHHHAVALAALEQRRADTPTAAVAASGGKLHRRVERLLHPARPHAASGILSAIGIMGITSALAFAGWQANTAQTSLAPTPAPPQVPAVTSAVALAPSQASAAQTASSPAPGTPYDKWLNEDVVYIISPEERATFERLATDEERQHFIEQFWRRRDPNPSTAINEAKDEHYRRIAYANQRFASTRPGWKTDRGRIYIQWGPPEEIESHPSGQGNMPPFEMWRYHAIEGVRPAIDMTFVDPRRDGEYQLADPKAGDARAGFNRMLRWTVTDPMSRFVTGLAPEHFDVRENGFSRTITYFSAPGTPTVVAVISDGTISGLANLPLRVIETRNVLDAVGQLVAAPERRKVLVATANQQVTAPAGIEVLRSIPADTPRLIVDIANQYVAGVVLNTPGAPVEIGLKPPPGLPDLKVNR